MHPVRPRGSPYSTVPPPCRHGHLLAPGALGAEGKSRSRMAPAVFWGWMFTGCPGARCRGGDRTAASLPHASGVGVPSAPRARCSCCVQPCRLRAPLQAECSSLSDFAAVQSVQFPAGPRLVGLCRAWCWCCCAVVWPGKPFAVGAVGSGAGFQLGAWHGGTCRSARGRGDAGRRFLARCSWDGSSRGRAGAAGCRAEPAAHVGSPQHPALGGVWKLRSFSVGLFFVLFLLLATVWCSWVARGLAGNLQDACSRPHQRSGVLMLCCSCH